MIPPTTSLISKIFGHIEEFVNPDPRQWIFSPTKEILIPGIRLKIKAIQANTG
jgi:hypothetical protein